MPNLRERVDLVRNEIPIDRGSRYISPLRRTIWASIEPGKTDGFRLVCRWSDLSQVTGFEGHWHLEIEGKQYKIATIEPYSESPRRFAAINSGSLTERGRPIPFSSTTI